MVTERVALRIEGRVQGVFFRESTRREAERLGLSGWVRNLPDGGVEAEAQGEEAPLQAFIAWCHKGPPAARVDRVQCSRRPALEDCTGFTVEPRP